MASVKINIRNVGATTARIRTKWENSVRPVLAETIKEDCNVYVRYWSGDLARSAHTRENGHYIVWKTAYARKVYYTGRPRRVINPNASLRWCEVAKRSYIGKWANEATNLFRR